MKVEVSCFRCHTKFPADQGSEERRAHCPRCQAVVTVPALDLAASSKPTASGNRLPPTQSARPQPKQPAVPQFTPAPKTEPPRPVAQRSTIELQPTAADVSDAPARNALLTSGLCAGGVALIVLVAGIAFVAGRRQQPTPATQPVVAEPVSPQQGTPASPPPASVVPPAQSVIAPETSSAATQPAPAKDELILSEDVHDATLNNAAATTPAPAATAVLSMPELVEFVEPAVVRINAQSKNGEVIGSGFVVDPSGLVVTNHHVIEGGSRVRVTFADGKSASVLGYIVDQPQRDIAVLKIDISGLTLKPIRLATDPPRKGEQVAAFGAPIGLSFSATNGIISAIRDSKELASFGSNLQAKVIQTSTPISSGNSGGPLVNMRGEVVGVNTAVLEVGQNLNFAVAASEVSEVLRLCTAASIVNAKMPAAKPGSQQSGRPGGATIKDETPEKSLDDPPSLAAVRELSISGVSTKVRIVELTTADADRRKPTKLEERDFSKDGKYLQPKRFRLVVEPLGKPKRTVSEAMLNGEGRATIRELWTEHINYQIKYRLVKHGGNLVEKAITAASSEDQAGVRMALADLALMYAVADLVLPPSDAEETNQLVGATLSRYVAQSGKSQLNSILESARRDIRRSLQAGASPGANNAAAQMIRRTILANNVE